MPYNTTAIPPRREPTGQTQLPLSRVKRIIGQDSEISMCSNNAAFIITLATEMFIQHLAEEAHTQTKLDRKPRRNIQYKDVANAVSHHDKLEFLQDTVPKTVPFRKVKAAAGQTQARLRGDTSADKYRPPTSHLLPPRPGPAGPKAIIVNGNASATPPAPGIDGLEDPGEQLRLEMMQAAAEAAHDGDVHMSG